MQEWLDFLKQNLSDADAKELLPIDRVRNLDFEWMPENSGHFEEMIANAPPNILEGLGFVRYNTLPEGPYRQDQDKVNDLVGEGCELFLFPVEWYSFIPEGFKVIDIYGRILPFEPGKTAKDTRIGCLGYGISVQVSPIIQLGPR